MDSASLDQFYADMETLKAKQENEPTPRAKRRVINRVKGKRKYNFIDVYSHMVGKTYGLLKVLEITNECDGHSMGCIIKCICKCGNPKSTRRLYLVKKHTRSCGCLPKGRRANKTVLPPTKDHEPKKHQFTRIQ